MKDLLKTIRSAEAYRTRPPKGPPDYLPKPSAEALDALRQTAYGQDLQLNNYAYQELQLVTDDDVQPVPISPVNSDDLDGRSVYGIDGSNQRIPHLAFHYVLTRGVCVRYQYARELQQSPVDLIVRDVDAIVVSDGNLFDDRFRLVTQQIKQKEGGKAANLLQDVYNGVTKPLAWRYNPDASDRDPSAQALGIAVQLQQTIELSLLREVDGDSEGLCIRDGPLFSTSVDIADNASALVETKSWRRCMLFGVSKRVQDSTLLVELLLHNNELRDTWFPNQNLTDGTLKAMATDSLLLPRLLKPGHRTPLIRAIGRARKGIVKSDPDLAPLACYYLSRTRPHTFIRIETPIHQWARSPGKVRENIALIAWQHELGRNAPLVQVHADHRCQLQDKLDITRLQLGAELQKKNHAFLEEYR